MDDVSRDFNFEIIWTDPPVVMFTAPNPGPRTLTGTHTYIVGRKQAYLIDPGPDLPGYQDALVTWSRDHQSSLRAILLTHGHPDHAPGAARIREGMKVPVWASDRMPSETASRLGIDRWFRSGQAFQTDADVLQVVPTPGHVHDHVAFWLRGAQILFAGDTILGAGTTLIAPPEGDMTAYMTSLESLRKLKPRLIAPGHGPVIRDPLDRIEDYIRHRRGREDQLLQALSTGPATVPELVQRVYVDVDPSVHTLAQGSVAAQLLKLAAEGRVEHVEGVYRRTNRQDQ